MSTQYSNLLVECYHALRGSDGALIEKANAQLLSLYENPSIIEDLFWVALHNEDAVIRLYSIVAIDKIINKNFNEFSEQQFQYIKHNIIQILSAETSDQNKCYICSIGTDILRKPEIGFPELLTLALNFLNNEDNISVALAAWSMFLGANVIDKDVFVKICDNLISCMVIALNQKEYPVLRMRAIHLIFDIEISGFCENLFQSFPKLGEALANECQFALENGLEEEILRAFEVLSFLFSIEFDDFGKYYDFYYNLSASAFANHNIKPIIREYVLQFFITFAETDPQKLENIYEYLIMEIFELLYVKCKESPETFQPLYEDRFFGILVEDDNFCDNVYGIIYQYIENQIQQKDLIRFKIGLMCLTFIVDAPNELLESNLDDINNIISVCMNINDEFVYSTFCDFIQNISEYAPMCLNIHLNSLIESFINHVNANRNVTESLLALDYVLSEAQTKPNNIEQIISSLINLLNMDNSDLVLPCISSAMLSSSTTNESLYEAIRGILFQLLQENISRPKVYQCFGACVSISPRNVMNDIPQFIQIMVSDLTNNLDIESLRVIACSIVMLVRHFPLSIQQYSNDFYSFFWEFITNTKSEPDEEERYTDNARGEVLKCLSSLFAAYPTQFEERFQELITLVLQTLTESDDPLYESMASEALGNLSPGLYYLNDSLQFDYLIDILIQTITNSTEGDLVDYLLSSLACILIEIGFRLSLQTVQKLISFYIESLQCKIPAISSNSKNIDSSLQAPLCYSLQSFILGGCFANSQQQNELVNVLLKYSKDKRKKVMQSYSIMALARICYVNPEQTQKIASIIIPIIFDIISRTKNITQRTLNTYYASLMYLLSSHIQSFTQEQVTFLKNAIENTFSSSAIDSLKQTLAVVWLEIVSMFNIQPSNEEFYKILSVMPPEIDDEGIPIFSNCIICLYNSNPQIFGEKLQKYVCTILASPHWCKVRIPQEHLSLLMQIISNLSYEQKLSIMNYNQSHTNNINSK